MTEGRVRAAWQAPAAGPDAEVERPSVAFRDVGGMDALKEEIRIKIIYPLTHPGALPGLRQGDRRRHPDVRAAGLRQNAPGPRHGRRNQGRLPGRRHQRRPRHVDRQKRAQPARALRAGTRPKPAVRAVLRRGRCPGRPAAATCGTAAGRQLINQFLAELDGVQAANEGVLILAATNAPWHLDPAFRRPGRFDRILFVPPPDAAARAAILRILCRGKPVERYRLRLPGQEDRPLLGRRSQGGRRRGHRDASCARR